MNNSYEAMRYLEKAFTIYNMIVRRKNISTCETYNFGENSGTAIVIIEATSKSLGKIIHCND